MSKRSRISRRTFLVSGASTAALTALAPAVGAAGEPARPNILWLVSEDNFPFIGAYGDDIARTPALDALAASGVLYANAFSNAPVCAPSRFAIITGMYAESCGPAHHMRAEARLPATLQGFPAYLRKAGYYCTNNSKTDYNAQVDMAMWHESSDQAHWRNRPKGAPFFAVFNLMTTHESQMFKPIDGRVKLRDVRVPAYLPDVPEVRRDIAGYYNLMERMDGQIAQQLAALDAAGLTDDTIVFYYSDNGGVLPRSKRYCYDQGLRTALMMRVPRKWAHLAPATAGRTLTTPVSLIDLPPTVLTIAGIDVPAHMEGVSLVPSGGKARAPYVFGMRNRMDERYDMMRTVRDERYRYIRNYSPHRIYAQHQAFSWQMDSYRALEREYLAGRLNATQARFFREKPAEELYDLQRDPDQINNLIDVPEHRERRAVMAAVLDEHMLSVNDNGFIPEGSPLEGYEASRVPGAYPLKRVMQLADLAICRDPDNIPDLIASLSDPNEVVRYWAAQGLLMLKERAATAKSALEQVFRKDASASVRIVAAEAFAALGEAERAARFLGDVLDFNENARIKLQALNALTYIGQPARAALKSIERASVNPADEYIYTAARYLALVLTDAYSPASQIYRGRGARQT